MDNRFQTGGKAENLNREERIAIRSRFFSILCHFSLDNVEITVQPLINSIDIVAFHCSPSPPLFHAFLSEFSLFITGQFGYRNPFPSRCITRDSVFREITVCPVWLMRTDSERRYYWPCRDTLEKYVAWIPPWTIFTVVLRAVWHRWCKRQGSLKATLTEIYTGLRFICEKERQSVITWDGILRRG